MPPKKDPPLTDEERARRIRELAAESGTSNDPEAFEKAFGKVAKPGREGDRANATGTPKPSIN